MSSDEQRRERADELLRRALLDEDGAAAVALKVGNLPLSDTVTVIFHGRRDLGTIQTYVAPGGHGAGDAVAGDALLRVPCDLDLAEAGDRLDAERLYAEQVGAIRDALVSADTVLDLYRESLVGLAGDDLAVDRSPTLSVRLPAPRLLPTALVAPERRLVVTAVCAARTLAAGRPPLGIACAQQDVARVYELRDDPERCLDDFMGATARHARALAERLEHQEASVERFLELNGAGDEPDAG